MNQDSFFIQRDAAVENFGKGLLPRSFIRAYGEVKKAVFLAIHEIDSYEENFFQNLLDICNQIIEGKLDHHFCLDLAQGGAGTSIHMTINEAISYEMEKQYGQKFHYLEDGAKFQSTNDTFPTALIITVYRILIKTEALIIRLQEELVRKEQQWQGILFTARTEMQNALPMDLSQLAGSWNGMTERDRWRFNKLKDRLRIIPLGGTAVGTGFFAPRDYVFRAEQLLREITALPLSRSQNLPDAVAHCDSLRECGDGFSLLAGNIYKLSNDLLIYSSSLSGEIRLPVKQYGSSIMPAKTNPVLAEFIKGQSINIEAEAAKIRRYCEEGNMQLNAFLPFVLKSFMEIEKAVDSSMDRLIGLIGELEPDQERINLNLASSQVYWNLLRPFLGYDQTKNLCNQAEKEDFRTIDELIKFMAMKTDFSEEELNQYFKTKHITGFYRGFK